MPAFDKDSSKKKLIKKVFLQSDPDTYVYCRPMRTGMLFDYSAAFDNARDEDGNINISNAPFLLPLFFRAIITTLVDKDGNQLFEDEEDLQDHVEHVDIIHLGFEIFRITTADGDEKKEESKQETENS